MSNNIDNQHPNSDLIQQLIANAITRVSPGLGLAYKIASQVAALETTPPELRRTATFAQFGTAVLAIAMEVDKPKPRRRRLKTRRRKY